MKKHYTHSDGGCFLFGNKDFSFKLPNNYGDCRNTVLIFDNKEEFVIYLKEKYKEDFCDRSFVWQTTIEAKFNLYNYDCCHMESKDIKARFDGRYSIYLRSVRGEYPVLAIVKD